MRKIEKFPTVIPSFVMGVGYSDPVVDQHTEELGSTQALAWKVTCCALGFL